ncbi:NAD(P)-dependent oxidoreductase [Cellulomonas fimi]|uniref:NAD(P)-dependent oxidoreductase n=1 Tax=Cellulomonas fimi TaxID=1708 RepID=A0A7Y0LVP4_CELFI|nr:NAD(P)-dependent oxidoreductase [Cellulomonas fimi]NMR18741.1 NAD(P)-dependent oxidoreductase [Cellulomonas fimi]
MTAVGYIGLGVMGAPMAGHVLRAGFPLHVTARRRESADGVVAAGARWQPTARQVAAQSDVVVLMVPDLPDVEDVLDGPGGLLAGIVRPLVVVVSSTVSPEGVRALDTRVRALTGGLARIVDAPVSGGEEGAVAGTLSIMVGGSDDDVAVTLPVLAATGTVVHLGPLGAGQVAKACNQMIVAATITALSEAAVVAQRAGLDVGALFDLLGGGYAGSRLMEVKKRRLAEHDHSPSGAARFLLKDLGFAAAEARRSGTMTPQLDVLRDVFAGLTSAGMGDSDMSVVQAYVDGLDPRSAPAGRHSS